MTDFATSTGNDPFETQLGVLEDQLRQLRESMRLARGTRDVSAAARASVEPTLTERIVAVLQGTPSSIEDLAVRLHVPPGRIANELKPLRKRLWNAGTEHTPKWFIAPPANATPDVFTAAVRALITEQPHTTGALMQATNTAGSKKVWHALTRLNDEVGSRMVRLGTPKKPRWFWVPESVDLRRFARRK